MGFQVSPGVNVTEIDLTTIVPAVATTNAGMAGGFQWGPVDERTLIDSENNLRQVFGDPNDATYNWWFTAANFLGYGNNLTVIRSVGSQAANAASHGNSAGTMIKNRKQFDAATGANALRSAEFVAKYPGSPGNSIAVVVFDDNGRTGGGAGHAMCLGLSAGLALGETSISGGFSSGTLAPLDFMKGDKIIFSNGDVHTITENLQGVCLSGQPSISTSELKFSPGLYSARASGTTFEIENRYASSFQSAPATSAQCAGAGGTNDEMNIAVIDMLGEWTGTEGEVLEVFEGVSKATNARGFDGRPNFYKDVINDRSKYVWAPATIAGVVTGDVSSTFTDLTRKMTGHSGGFSRPVGHRVAYMGMSGGVSADDYTKGGTDLSNADLVTSFLEFEDAETVDVSLILGGVSDATAQKILIDMCDKRKDCIAFLSPVESSSVPAGLVQNKTAGEAATTVRDWRNNTLNKSSSYAVLDSGFKVMLDRYNDVLRYVPLNGDIAGLCARTEVEQEAWFSPAGFNRGQIRGVVKLAFEPRKAHRDELYKAGVNPVVSFPGEGTVLFGDKTMQAKPSAFDRINVRRLFIVLEKAIATASKYLLFEFNDEFTRAQFRNMVIPFLRTIMSRRGIYDFKVVCDETNNTGEVIDRNEFVGDIYIKPARSINFIQLNFIATKTGVDFSEVGG